MSKGKRNRRRPKRKSIEAMEHGLAQLTKLQLHAEKRVNTLRTKVAAQEGLIEEAKLEEKEKAAAEASG